jgi:hypothetical protein
MHARPLRGAFEQLVQSLSERLQGDERLSSYILVDPLLREPWDGELLRESLCVEYNIGLGGLPVREDQHPRLIKWRPQAVEVMRTSLALAFEEQNDPRAEATQGFAIGGWLLTAAAPEELCRHLARAMQLYRPGQGLRYFRWADRRVSEWMWPALDAAQRQALLGPITEWWQLDRCDALTCFSNGDASSNGVGGAPLRLTQNQWEWADEGATVQDLLRGWRGFTDALPGHYLKMAGDAVSASQALGLRSTADIVLMAAYVIQIHPDLCTHRRVRRMVQGALADGASISQALSTIPDAQWDEIRMELEQIDGGLAATQRSIV